VVKLKYEETPERKAKKKEALARFRENNRERLRLAQIEFRKTPEHKAWKKAYSHRDDVKEKKAQRSKERGAEWQNRYKQTEKYAVANKRRAATFAYLLKKAKGNAKTRGLTFEITAQDVESLAIKQNMLCALSGARMTMDLYDPCKLSIDRVDSEKGYTTDNIQLVTAQVNIAKSYFGNAEFIEMCTHVAVKAYTQTQTQTQTIT
jgi:hypothetical protein